MNLSEPTAKKGGIGADLLSWSLSAHYWNL